MYTTTTVSGCVREEFMAYYGYDIGKAEKSGEGECASWCYQTQGCNYWTLRSLTNKCLLKTSDAGRTPYSDRVTGNKMCGAPAGKLIAMC